MVASVWRCSIICFELKALNIMSMISAVQLLGSYWGNNWRVFVSGREFPRIIELAAKTESAGRKLRGNALGDWN